LIQDKEEMREVIERGFDKRILNYRITLQYRFNEITLRYTSTERLSHHRMLLYPYPQKDEATTNHYSFTQKPDQHPAIEFTYHRSAH